MLGSFEFRRTLGIIAATPRFLLLDDPKGVNDDVLILDLCPTDYAAQSWVWIVEQGARRLLQAEWFHQAFGAARDRIAAEA